MVKTKENGPNLSILIAEDVPVQAKKLKFYLEKFGYSVTWSANGEEAFNELKSKNFDLILSDIQMPKMDGLEFLNKVRKTPELRDQLFVLLTTLDESDLHEKVIQLGATDFITKPFKPLELQLRLKNILDKRRVEQTVSNAERTKSRFLATMSHEIRTPLNGLIGMTEMLSETVLDQVQNEIVKDIKNCSDNLLTLIDDILDLSKIESGNLQLKMAPFDIKNLITTTIQTCAYLLQGKHINIDYTIDDDVPKTIVSDETRINQIFLIAYVKYLLT